MPELFEPTLDDLVRCAEREVKKRREVYGRLVNADPPKMSRETAQREIHMMELIAARLRHDQEKSRERIPGQ